MLAWEIGHTHTTTDIQTITKHTLNCRVGAIYIYIYICLLNAFLQCPCSVLNCNLQIINFFAAFVVLLVQVFAKPYKDTHNNIIETAILVNLVLVAASYLQSPETTAASVMVVILTLLPYVYAVVYIAIATGRKM